MPAARAVSEDGPEVWHALRVSVKPSARDPGLFIVRRLDDGHTPPPGSREALIMVLEPGSDLFASASSSKDA
jgi:hypothetical protein